jgi:serine/threonine protein kinase
VFHGVTNEAGAPDPAPAAESEGCALPLGTRLAEFEVQQVLGAGGFGIVYLALDHSLMRQVAIKEYYPSVIATRGSANTLKVRVASDAGAFAAGLRSFLNEARLLAGFDHASLVKVHRYWAENGTAYMVMPYYAGRTLKQVRHEMPTAPDGAWLRGVLEPLLGALELLHSQSVYHRDVSPDNVMLLPDGRPLLLDFGSARRMAVGSAAALTAIVKPHFAPVEQYADMAKVPQGPWTDLYAVGAVAHFLVHGEPPPPAVMRAMQDDLPLLANDPDIAARIGAPLAAAIDWALAVDPRQRPQRVADLLAALRGERVPPPPALRSGGRSSIGASLGPWPQTAVQTVALGPLPTPATMAEAEARSSAVPSPSMPRPRVRHPAIAGVLAIGVLAAALLGWANRPLGSRTAPVEPAAAVASVATPAPVAPADRRPLASIADRKASVVVDEKRSPPVAVAAAAKPRSRPPAAPVVAEPNSAALDACAGKVFLLKAICVRRACEQPQLQAHAECVRMRQQDEARVRADAER